MTNKKFISYQLKCWLPIFVISLIFIAIVNWVEVASMNILYSPAPEYAPYLTTYGGSALLSSLIPAMILTLIYPMTIFDYRFSKSTADTFLQLPLKEKELKRTRLNISLIMIFLAFTIVYWIGVLFLLIRVSTTTLTAQQIADGYTIGPYNFLGYLFAYLLALVFLAAEFYTNAFLFQLGNTAKEGMAYMVMGQIILLLAEYSIHNYIVGGLVHYYYGPRTCTFSLGTPVYLISHIFDGYIVGSNAATNFANLAYNELINFVVVLLVGIGSAIPLYLLRDPSGEHYGKQGPRTIAISIIPHVAFGLVGLLLYTVNSISGCTMIYFLFVLGYYMSLASIYRSFRIPKKQLITMIIVSAVILVLTIIAFARMDYIYY